MAKCFDQKEKTRKRDRITGVNNVNFTTLAISHLTIDHAPVVILNVKLDCNLNLSPWCDCSNQESKKTKGERDMKFDSKNKSVVL